MLGLPRHHVPRAQLRARVGDAPLVVIEAASGFGKSTFATELIGAHRTIEVALSTLDGDRRGFFRQLRRALLRAGERTAASGLDDSSARTDQVIDALHDSLAGTDPFTLLVEDAHHLGAGAAVLVDLARRRPAPMRMIVTARVLPPRARALLAIPDAEHVRDEDLRFGVRQAEILVRGNLGLDIDDADLAQLVERTAGWPAGLALAGTQLRRRAGVPRALESEDLHERFMDLVLDAIPAPLLTDIVQLAHLPSIDTTVAAALTGRNNFLDEVLALGLPLAYDSDGLTRFPGALADALQSRADLAPAAGRRVARVYVDQGRPVPGIEVLRLSGNEEELARLITGMPPVARRRLSADEMIAAINSLPVAMVHRYPQVLIELARAAARTGVPGAQQEALDRAAAAAPDVPAFSRAIEAERMTYELYTLYINDRQGQAQRVRDLIAACGPGEERTLGRALAVQGQQLAWDGRRGEADHTLRRAAAVLADAGDEASASAALVQLGFNVHLHEQLAVAEETFAEAVRLAGDDGRARATALTYLGEVKVWRGRSAEGVVDLVEAEALARATRDARAHAYAAWGLALHASVSGDVERTVARVEQAGRLLREWIDTGVGATYVSTMTDLLDRVGAREQAEQMLTESRRRRTEAPELVTLAEFGVAARGGDADLAETLWAAVERDQGIEPFERVRCRLLRAFAALRRDDENTGRFYRELIADGESLGDDGVPWHLEPVAARELQQWWARQSTGWRIRLLGDFEVRQGDRRVQLPAGRPTELVMFLALHPQPQRIDTVIDALWGEDTDTAGLARLRQVLYRLRQAAPNLIVRGPAQLRLAAEVTIDLNEFERWSARALRNRSDRESAERAVALVDDVFFLGAAPSSIAPDFDAVRARVRARLLLLWGTLAEAAPTEAAIAHLERAHALEPADPARAERLATLLLADGRATQAKFVLDATIEALSSLQVALPPGLAALHRRARHVGSVHRAGGEGHLSLQQSQAAEQKEEGHHHEHPGVDSATRGDEVTAGGSGG